MLDLIKEIVQNIDMLSVLVFCFCLFLFLFFLTLGFYFLKKKVIASLFFVVSFACLVATPFVIMISAQMFFYKIEIVRNDSKPLTYSNSFFIDMEFKNQGKRNFDRCLIVVVPERKVKNLKNKILDFIKPLASYKYHFRETIKVKQTFYIQKFLSYHYREYPFKITLDCR